MPYLDDVKQELQSTWDELKGGYKVKVLHWYFWDADDDAPYEPPMTYNTFQAALRLMLSINHYILIIPRSILRFLFAPLQPLVNRSVFLKFIISFISLLDLVLCWVPAALIAIPVSIASFIWGSLSRGAGAVMDYLFPAIRTWFSDYPLLHTGLFILFNPDKAMRQYFATRDDIINLIGSRYADDTDEAMDILLNQHFNHPRMVNIRNDDALLNTVYYHYTISQDIRATLETQFPNVTFSQSFHSEQQRLIQDNNSNNSATSAPVLTTFNNPRFAIQNDVVQDDDNDHEKKWQSILNHTAWTQNPTISGFTSPKAISDHLTEKKWFDPISFNVLKNPVLLPSKCGNYISQKYIHRLKNDVLTNLPLTQKDYDAAPNQELDNEINTFLSNILEQLDQLEHSSNYSSCLSQIKNGEYRLKKI